MIEFHLQFHRAWIVVVQPLLFEAFKCASEYGGTSTCGCLILKESLYSRLIRDCVQGLGKEVEILDKLVFRKVPVTWYGLASDVRLVGDFDNWSEGFSLSPEEIRDQTFTKFTAEVPLRPVSACSSG